jgi:beta-galactosidase GanA
LAGVQSANVPAGIELVHRSNGKSEFVFAFNYFDEKAIVPFEGSGVDLLTGNKINDSIELEPRGVRIIQGG